MLELPISVGVPPEQIVSPVETIVPFSNAGFTLTVIFVAEPTHDPVTDVGVTAYMIEPVLVLLGFVNTCAMLLPLEAVEPVIDPVLVPNVQA